MKLDGATIPIRQRSAGECLDLAIRLCRADARPLAALTLAVGGPACLTSWWLSTTTLGGLGWALTIFWFATPLLGALIVAGEGPRVFGGDFTALGAAKRLVPRAPAALFPVIFPRTILWIPAFLTAFAAPLASVIVVPLLIFCCTRGSRGVREVILLEGLRGGEARRRVRDLRRGSEGALLTFSSNWSATFFFFSLAVPILFLLADVALEVLFGFPLYLGRLADSSPSAVEYNLYLILSDPLVVTGLSITLWILYPIARVALFLSYLDTRIRREGWDLELDFRVEARRLAGTR